MSSKYTPAQLEEWGRIRNTPSQELVNPKTGRTIERGKSAFAALEAQWSRYEAIKAMDEMASS